MMASLRLGLQRRSQRRGVIPFVLFWNLPGNISWKSLNLRTMGNIYAATNELCEWVSWMLTSQIWWFLSVCWRRHWRRDTTRCTSTPYWYASPPPPQRETYVWFYQRHLATSCSPPTRRSICRAWKINAGNEATYRFTSRNLALIS